MSEPTRPEIRDVKVQKYVAWLEEKLRALSVDNIQINSYKSLRNFVENNNKVLTEAHFTKQDLSDKEDKFIERAFKYADKVLDYNEALDKMYDKIGDKWIDEDEEQESATAYEEAIKKAKEKRNAK